MESTENRTVVTDLISSYDTSQEYSIHSQKPHDSDCVDLSSDQAAFNETTINEYVEIGSVDHCSTASRASNISSTRVRTQSVKTQTICSGSTEVPILFSSDSESSSEPIEVLYCTPDQSPDGGKGLEKLRLRAKWMQFLKDQQSKPVKDQDCLKRLLPEPEESLQIVPAGSGHLVPVKCVDAMQLVTSDQRVGRKKSKRQLKKDEAIFVRPI